jgi:acyl dehydratase
LEYDATRLRALAVRFTAPVYPGDCLRFQLWRQDATGILRLRACVESDGRVALDNGIVEIG